MGSEDKDGKDASEQANTQTCGDAARLATFNQYRGLLFSVAYRMLGSVADAEDMVQETFIRWQQAANEEIRSPRAFLVTVITRLSINQLQSARVRREEYVGEWLPEPLVTGPESDPLGAPKVDESLSMAFLLLLERLTPMERAVFLLREVFEYEYAEIANVLGQSETNCRQILRRAKQHVGDMRRRFDASAESMMITEAIHSATRRHAGSWNFSRAEVVCTRTAVGRPSPGDGGPWS
jgi:RNA polymerase sigma-70 factor (ECF subfamily)